MSSVVAVLLFTALGTIALKGAGPILLGGRPLPPRLDGVVRLAGPALLGALVAVSTFALGQTLVVDERAARARRRRGRDPPPRAGARRGDRRRRRDGGRARAGGLTRAGQSRQGSGIGVDARPRRGERSDERDQA